MTVGNFSSILSFFLSFIFAGVIRTLSLEALVAGVLLLKRERFVLLVPRKRRQGVILCRRRRRLPFSFFLCLLLFLLFFLLLLFLFFFFFVVVPRVRVVRGRRCGRVRRRRAAVTARRRHALLLQLCAGPSLPFCRTQEAAGFLSLHHHHHRRRRRRRRCCCCCCCYQRLLLWSVGRFLLVYPLLIHWSLFHHRVFCLHCLLLCISLFSPRQLMNS